MKTQADSTGKGNQVLQWDKTVESTCMMLDIGCWVYDTGLPSATQLFCFCIICMSNIQTIGLTKSEINIEEILTVLPDKSQALNYLFHLLQIYSLPAPAQLFPPQAFPKDEKFFTLSINSTSRGSASIKHLRDTIKSYPKKQNHRKLAIGNLCFISLRK